MLIRHHQAIETFRVSPNNYSQILDILEIHAEVQQDSIFLVCFAAADRAVISYVW